MGAPVKKFLATLLIAAFTFSAGIGCSGDTKKEKTEKSSKKEDSSTEKTTKKDTEK